MKIALVLPGAGAKGAYYEGVIRAIETYNIPINKVYGASIGALQGALFCMGQSPGEREQIWLRIGDKFKSLAKSRFHRYFFFMGFKSIKADKGLKKWLKVLFKGNFEALRPPLAVSVADLKTGYNFIFEKGELSDPVIASSALVPALSMHPFNNILGADGGINNNIMLDKAIEDGNDVIILPIVTKLREKSQYRNWLDILFRTIAIKLRQEIFSEVDTFPKRYPGKKLIRIESSQQWVSDQSALDFSSDYVKRAIKQGFEDTAQVLTEFIQEYSEEKYKHNRRR